MKHSVFFSKSPLMNKVITLLCIFVCFFFITIVTNTTLSFASTEISNAAGTLRLNQDQFEVSASSNQIVKVYGTAINPQYGDKVTIIFTMPDGDQQGSQLFPTEDGHFETFLFLDDSSQRGTYSVFASFRTQVIGSLSFVVTQKEFSPSDNSIPSSPVPQRAQSVLVATDKSSYSDREKISITGDVREFISGIPASVTVIGPNGNLVAIAQVDVGADKKFSAEITAGGTMKSEGTYTIRVLYGTKARTAETTFYFGGSTLQTPSIPQIPSPTQAPSIPQIPSPTQTPSIPQTPSPTQTPSTPQTLATNGSFPIEYVIVGIVIVVVAGIAIALSKRRKAAPMIVQPSGQVPVTPASDDTQFWVCNRCHGELQMKSGRQYCPSCNVYL